MNYNLFPLPNRSHFTILDVGSYEITCIVASIKGGELKILAVTQVQSKGIDGGSISNIVRAKESIMLAVEEAEKISEQSIDDAYVNIVNCDLKSRLISGGIDVSNKNITEGDIAHLMKQITEKIDELIVQIIPLEYHIDGIQEVSNPIGMFSNRLSVNAHILTANKTLIINLEHCLEQCGIQLKHCFFSCSSCGAAVLTEDEKDLGAAVLDIGGNYVSIGVFKKGSLCAAEILNIGGVHITRDLASGLNTSLANAEKIKRMYGSTVVQNNTEIKFSTISDSINNLNISPEDIVGIIRPRVEEILEMSQKKLKIHQVNTVVIGGGGNKIWGIEDVAKEILGVNVRSGYINYNITDFTDHYNSSLYSAMGLATMLKESTNDKNINVKKIGTLKKVLNFFKNL